MMAANVDQLKPNCKIHAALLPIHVRNILIVYHLDFPVINANVIAVLLANIVHKYVILIHVHLVRLVFQQTTPTVIGVYVIDTILVSIVKIVYQKRVPPIGGVIPFVVHAIVTSAKVMMAIVTKQRANVRVNRIVFNHPVPMFVSNVIAIQPDRILHVVID